MRFPAILAALAAVAPLSAEATLDYGVTATLAKPVADIEGGPWLTGRYALGIGVRLPWRIDDLSTIVPRADLLNIPEGDVHVLSFDSSTNMYNETAKAQIRSIGADYDMFFLEHRDATGPYFLAGLAWSEVRFSNVQLQPGGWGGPLPDGVSWPTEQTKKVMQYALGMGWKFTPAYGAEFRFTQGSYRSVGLPGLVVKAPVFGISLTAQF
jgi:hypothetical protein